MNSIRSAAVLIDAKAKEFEFPKYVKYINLSIGSILVIVGVWKIITLQIFFDLLSLQFFNIFVPFFLILFGGILFLSEYKPAIVFEYLKFMKTYFGLGTFYLFLSSLTVYKVESETNQIFGWIYGILLFTVGVYYITLHFLQKKREDLNDDSRTSSYTAPIL